MCINMQRLFELIRNGDPQLYVDENYSLYYLFN